MEITCASAFTVKCTVQQKSPATPPSIFQVHCSSSSSIFKWQPIPKKCEKNESLSTKGFESIKEACRSLACAVVNSAFKFEVNQRISQGNFAPVEEIGEAVAISTIEGEIPMDFPEGVYIRNGPNPIDSSKTVAISVLGITKLSWFQGDGMLHATYFTKNKGGDWTISYKNRYVEAETLKLEKNSKSSFLPTIEGEPLALLASLFLNMIRFGKANKDSNNTSVFQHMNKIYTTSEHHLPHEVNISNLDTCQEWDVNGAWDRPFTSHPKVAPETGELVIMGTDVKKPYYVLGVISADGRKLIHKVDLKFERPVIVHELGVTEQYNIIMDYPLAFGMHKLFGDGMFIKFERDQNSRIGVMPRYGDADSIIWFQVENHCSFHLINTFEDGKEIIVRGCRTNGSILPGPSYKADELEWYGRAFKYMCRESEGFDPSVDGIIFPRPYEWRLNRETGEVSEAFLTGTEYAMDFPTMNNNFLGCKTNKYAYTQVLDSETSCNTGMSTYKMFAKLHFDEKEKGDTKFIKVEYHKLQEGTFCSGLQFVGRPGGSDEDDGWLLCYVHHEREDVSQVYIIDAKKFSEEPVAKITLPQRVPYGFHATFVSKGSMR